jgi:hypothetical protein
MDLTEEEKEEYQKSAVDFFNTSLFAHEKIIFENFLNAIELSFIDYFKYSLPLLYIRNDKFELDTYNLATSLLAKHIESLGQLSPEKEEAIEQFGMLTPRLIALNAEFLRRNTDLTVVRDYYLSCINNLKKVLENFSDTDSFEPLSKFIFDLEKRKTDIEQEISEELSAFQNPIEVSAIEHKSFLIWKGGFLLPVSKKIHSLGLTNLPTDFDKVFTEKKTTEWKGDLKILAHLLYRLKSFKNNAGVPDSKISASGKHGYFKTANEYFLSGSAMLPLKDADLSDLAFKVRKHPSKHQQTIGLVDSIISKILS